MSPPARFGVWFQLWLALSAVGCGDRAPQAKSDAGRDAEGAKEVTLTAVTAVPLDRAVEVSGTLDAFERVTVAAKIPGRVVALPIDLASPVALGDVIARLELVDYQLDAQQAAASLEASRAQLGLRRGEGKLDGESTALVREARATLHQANAGLVRAKNLSAEGLLSGGDLEAAEAAATRAEAGLQSARDEVRFRESTLRERAAGLARAQQALTDTSILSPIKGVVQARFVDTGEYVAVGAPIAEIVSIDPLRLRVAVPERQAVHVRNGNVVNVRIEGDDRTHTGIISRVAPALDPQSRTLLAEADVKNVDHLLRPGTLVTARIVFDRKSAPTVPSTALMQFAGLTKVVTVVDGKANEVVVHTGQTVGDRTEIVSGVEVGTPVVEKPGSLRHGQLVRVAAGP